MRKTCFFIGHRHTPGEVRELLADAVERHIVEYGVTEFVVGHYGSFDRMAAHAVTNAKQRHPEVSLFVLSPYYPDPRGNVFVKNANGTFYPPDMESVPKRLAIVRANRYMVEHSDYLIACAWSVGNAREVVEYARAREKRGLIHVENLAEGIVETVQ